MNVFNLLLFNLQFDQSSRNPCLKSSLTQPEYLVCSQIFTFRKNTKDQYVNLGRATQLVDVDINGGRKFAPGVREAQRKKEDEDDKKNFVAKLASQGLSVVDNVLQDIPRGLGKGPPRIPRPFQGILGAVRDILGRKKRDTEMSFPEDAPKRKKRQWAPAGTIYDCMNIPCICSFLGGSMYTSFTCQLPDGSFYQRAYRKEFRMMTYNEMVGFQNAFWTIRNGAYWTLAGYHGNTTACPGAHSGPNFLPWHREFLKRLEIGMRTYQLPNGTFPFVNVYLPYWDSSMDNDVYQIFGMSSYYSSEHPKVAKRFVGWFSEYLHGLVYNGNLADGWFGGWTGRQGNTYRVLDQWPGQVNLFSRSVLDSIVADPVLNDILASTAGDPNYCPTVPSNNFEIQHGNVHVWFGGNMQIITQSTNDPMFFLHHCFIDFIWEQWRQTNQDRYSRETQWNSGGTSCYSPSHQQTATMLPFLGRVNQDGLSNQYTDYMYTYQPRPTCSASVPCSSPYLWCYVPYGRCVARIKPGATCWLVSGVDPCFVSSCVGGRCVATGK